ncbi:MAG: LysR substrate-binding domain-containing protein [Nocardioides sp.]|uniref:LysR substrate-binding domain-containing protein n=1 Tax=Nocardioides sp. TaxID=35761 RepID=UPI00326779C5
MRGSRRGSVVVAVLPSLAATMLPSVLRAYRTRHPEVSVGVRDGLSGHVLDLVRSGAVDLALTVVDAVPDYLVATPVARDRFSCLLAPSHPWCGRQEVSWAELADEPFVAFDHSSSVRSLTDQVLAERGVRLGPTTEASNIGAVAGLVAADLGVSAAPGFVLPLMAFGGLATLDLVDPVVEREICLLHDPRRPTTPDARALVEMLRSAADYDIVLPPGA